MKHIAGSLLFIASLLCINACVEVEISTSHKKEYEIKLKACNGNELSIQSTRNSTTPNTVGVFVIDNDNSMNSQHCVFNKSYRTDEWGFLTAANGQKDVYPENGDNIRIISYYPFYNNINQTYIIDLTSQNDNHNKLFYAQTEWVNKEQVDYVELQYCAQLVQLNVRLKDAEGLPATHVKASIRRPTKATFHLINGVMEVDTHSETQIALKVTDAQINSLILPGEFGAVMIEYKGEMYEWDTSHIDFALGETKEYTLHLIPNASDTTDMEIGNTTVEDWVHVNGGTIIVR